MGAERIYATEIRAIDPTDGELKTWAGPHVRALTWGMAERWCQAHMGYCRVVGELVRTVPSKPGTLEPDWRRAVDHSTARDN